MNLFAKLALFVGLTGSLCGNETLSDVKAKWMQWANARVEEEKAKFLDLYNLNVRHLDYEKAIISVRSNLDRITLEGIEHYKREHWWNKFLFWKKTNAYKKDTESIQGIADKVFAKPQCDRVEVINVSDFERERIEVSFHYANRESYVLLNCQLHKENLSEIEAILRHEYCHIVYEDAFNLELIQCAAWCNSDAEHETIENQSRPIGHACETRADVYALIHSSDNGKSYINAFNGTDGIYDLNHPAPKERVALLEQIEAELDGAKEKIA